MTCSDEAPPMRVVQAGAGGLAVCRDEEGNEAEVMTDLVGPVDPGDTLLVHAGTALARADGPPPESEDSPRREAP